MNGSLPDLTTAMRPTPHNKWIRRRSVDKGAPVVTDSEGHNWPNGSTSTLVTTSGASTARNSLVEVVSLGGTPTESPASTVLDLTGQGLVNLPLPNGPCHVLNLSYNQLPRIPLTLCRDYQALRVLVLSHNLITTLPKEIGQLQNLRELYLGHNQISVFPEALGELSKLEVLDLSHNRIRYLNIHLTRLSSLRVLDLSFNQLVTIPSFVGLLYDSLITLNIQGNPFTEVASQFFSPILHSAINGAKPVPSTTSPFPYKDIPGMAPTSSYESLPREEQGSGFLTTFRSPSSLSLASSEPKSRQTSTDAQDPRSTTPRISSASASSNPSELSSDSKGGSKSKQRTLTRNAVKLMSQMIRQSSSKPSAKSFPTISMPLQVHHDPMEPAAGGREGVVGTTAPPVPPLPPMIRTRNDQTSFGALPPGKERAASGPNQDPASTNGLVGPFRAFTQRLRKASLGAKSMPSSPQAELTELRWPTELPSEVDQNLEVIHPAEKQRTLNRQRSSPALAQKYSAAMSPPQPVPGRPIYRARSRPSLRQHQVEQPPVISLSEATAQVIGRRPSMPCSHEPLLPQFPKQVAANRTGVNRTNQVGKESSTSPALAQLYSRIHRLSSSHDTDHPVVFHSTPTSPKTQSPVLPAYYRIPSKSVDNTPGPLPQEVAPPKPFLSPPLSPSSSESQQGQDDEAQPSRDFFTDSELAVHFAVHGSQNNHATSLSTNSALPPGDALGLQVNLRNSSDSSLAPFSDSTPLSQNAPAIGTSPTLSNRLQMDWANITHSPPHRPSFLTGHYISGKSPVGGKDHRPLAPPNSSETGLAVSSQEMLRSVDLGSTAGVHIPSHLQLGHHRHTKSNSSQGNPHALPMPANPTQQDLSLKHSHSDIVNKQNVQSVQYHNVTGPGQTSQASSVSPHTPYVSNFLSTKQPASSTLLNILSMLRDEWDLSPHTSETAQLQLKVRHSSLTNDSTRDATALTSSQPDATNGTEVPQVKDNSEMATANSPMEPLSNEAQLEKRRRIVMEILDTERTYVDCLLRLVKIYIAPLDQSVAGRSGVSLAVSGNGSNLSLTSLSRNASSDVESTSDFSSAKDDQSSQNSQEEEGQRNGEAQLSEHHRQTSGTQGSTGLPLSSSLHQAFGTHHLKQLMSGTTTSSVGEVNLDTYYHKYQGVLSSTEIKGIFSNVDSLLMFHRDHLLPELEQCVQQPDERLGSVFLRNSAFIRIYSVYVNNFDNATKLLSDLEKQRKKITKFLALARRHPDHNQLNLLGYLLLPVQRVPRYKLLLEQLLEATPRDHPDYSDLVRALEQVRERADEINEKKREQERNVKVIQIANQIRGSQRIQLIQPHRRFIRRGTLYLEAQVTPTRNFRKHPLGIKINQVDLPFEFYLFNDLMLQCSKSETPHNQHLLNVLKLDTKVCPAQVLPDGATLRVVDKSGVFYFHGERAELEQWAYDINNRFVL
ncbi:hypothetical protein IWQ62_003960 [Dispira parvispora]|uniref:DH domain-containing protein n=1 Tax=Dispira parvispora TaxID=1520584 RepID=A0A9W8AST7_9FUNG|nr:hypothetical protein IWQ62_003960 [Dispira parvispora]